MRKCAIPRTWPVVPQREYFDSAHVRFPEDAPRISIRGVQPAQSHDLGKPGFDNHECQLRARDDIEQRPAPDAVGIAVGILTPA